MITIKKEEWEELWSKINGSIKNWNTPESRNYEYMGKLVFDGYRLEWLHHYSTNYEGVPFNNIMIYYYLPNQSWTYDKAWKRVGNSYPCNISNSQIKSLRESVEKFLVKKGVSIE